jgi:hypothetical protein
MASMIPQIAQDFNSRLRYTGECEDLTKYALRLLCPDGHGVISVLNAEFIGNVKRGRFDYDYTLGCGCIRRKALPALHLVAKMPCQSVGRYAITQTA